MMNNRNGPKTGFTGCIKSTRDDPNIGRFKRCKARAEMLIANRLAGQMLSEWERNGQKSSKFQVSGDALSEIEVFQVSA